MDGSKVKAYSLAGSGIAATVTMILLAMALAQRDARTQDSLPIEGQPSYANQTVEGITHDLSETPDSWPPPPPVVRGNDSMPGSEYGGTSTRGADPSNPFRSPASLVAYSQQQKENPPATLAEPPGFGAGPSLPSLGASPTLPGSPLPSGSPLPTPLPSNISTGNALPSTSLPPTTSALPPETNAALPSDLSPSPFSAPRSLPSAGTPLPTAPTTSTPLPNALPPELGSSGAARSYEGNALPGPSALEGGPATARLQPPTLPNESIDPQSQPSSVLPNQPLPTTPMRSFDNVPPPLSEGDTLGGNSANRSAQDIPEPMPRSNTTPKDLPTSSTRSSLSDRSEISSLSAIPVGAGTVFASPAPGVRHLDGAQNPSMEIQKRAPAEVQVGLPATFTILVRNVGSATAFDVAVHDAVPRGAKLVRTNPTAQVDGSGKLLWKLGEIAAGAEQVLTVELVPEAEGELGSVASVTFAAQASVRTMSTLPKLVVKQTAAESVLGGETVRIQIEVTNTGTGTARGVELEEDVPANMRHSSGSSTLGMTLGDLAPGESERVEIELTAVSAGQAINKVRAISTNQAASESSATIAVVLPKLAVQLEGPRLRYLERQATYRATISNTGTAIANNVGLTLYLPRGMEFISAANDGTYMPDQHAVEWSLVELGAGAMATTEVALLPVQEGEFVLRMQGTADGVNSDPIDKKVQVEGQSELAFSIEDDNDPIETDGFTTYLIRISNTGTRMDSDVQLVLELPEGSKSEQVHAPVNHQASQKAIVFAPIPAMQPKDQQVYRVSVRHTREGTHVVRAQLKSKNRPVPVVKEESTQVYMDN